MYACYKFNKYRLMDVVGNSLVFCLPTNIRASLSSPLKSLALLILFGRYNIIFRIVI